MSSSNSQIDKPQGGHPKRAELPDVNINTGVQSINTERASLDYLQLSVLISLWKQMDFLPVALHIQNFQ